MYINLLLISSLIISAQRVTIWNDPLTHKKGLSEWHRNNGGSIASSTDCPSFTTCYIYEKTNELWRYDSTVGFHSIQVHYTLRSIHMLSPRCELWYIIGQQNDDTFTGWILIDATNANNKTIQRTVSIPEANDNDIIGITVFNDGANEDNVCYMNNVSMTGIPLTATTTTNTEQNISHTTDNTSTTRYTHTTLQTTPIATTETNESNTTANTSTTPYMTRTTLQTTHIATTETNESHTTANTSTTEYITTVAFDTHTTIQTTPIATTDTNEAHTTANTSIVSYGTHTTLQTTPIATAETNEAHTTALPINSSITPYTTLPPIIINATCLFSDDFLMIWIMFHNINIEYSTSNTLILCSDIFINSNTLLGDSKCYLTDIITIELASDAVIDVNDVLFISSNAFSYIHNNEIIWNSHLILLVSPPLSPLDPVIVVGDVSIIGAYDDLILNAVNSMNLGGRNAIFGWEFVSSKPNNVSIVGSVYYGDIVVVDSNEMPINCTMYINVWLITWYNKTMIETFIVYKSYESIPNMVLSGINTYSETNHNEYINIAAVITYNDPFIPFPYSLYWSISSNTLQQKELIIIENYLHQQNELENVDNIAIDTTLLSPGNDYIFRAQLICDINREYYAVCKTYNTSATLSIMYEWSDIVCSMYSADAIYIDHLTSTQFIDDYVLYLDGYTMTYDPNAFQIDDKSHFKWEWQCVDINNISCDHLFNSGISTKSSKYITFENADDNGTDIEYHFTMSVYDTSNDNRAYCTDTLDVYVDILDGLSDIKHISLFLTTSDTVINSNERLRIIVIVLNDEVTADESYYQYEWTEINQQIIYLSDYNLNTGSSGNLILPENVLDKGKTYQFQVTVTKWSINDGEALLIGNGSSWIDIEILDGARILDLNIYPNCQNRTYSSFLDVFNEFYYLSVISDTEYVPLSYEFVYIYDGDHYAYNIHRSVIPEPYVFQILLPFGTFTIKSIVYDSKSSMTEQEIQCDIHFSNINFTRCVSLRNDIIKPLKYASNNQLLLYLLQSTEIYLNYMEFQEYYLYIDTLCLQHILTDIIDLYNEILIQDKGYNFDFCVIDWTLFFAKICTKYLNILIKVDAANGYKIFISNLHGIESLISLILDPCFAITDTVIDIDLLFVSPQSIIDGNPIIYYKKEENDITHLINHDILSDITNSYALYEMISSVITIVQDLNEVDILNDEIDFILDLLSKSLYIHTLFQISSTIPGETTLNNAYDGFEIYSSRIGIDGTVNTSVDGIHISIGNDAFHNGRDPFCDITEHIFAINGKSKCRYNSVDVIITSLNNTQTNVYVEHRDCFDGIDNGTLSNSSISIMLIGGNITGSNTSIVFNDDDKDDTECVWFDGAEDLWKNTGCTTLHFLDSIECDCNHLTTFSLVHNINLDKCNNLLKEIGNSISWRNAHIVFGVLFFLILCDTLCSLLPFIIHRHYNPLKEKALLSISLLGIISSINILICVFFGSLGPSASFSSSSKAVYTFLLLCPQWVYFVIFSIVLYSWIIVVYRSKSTSTLMIGRSLMSATIAFIVYGFFDFVFISFVRLPSKSYWIYSLSQIIWIVLILLATVTFTIFGYFTQRIVRNTAKMVRDNTTSSSTQQIAAKDLKLANKLLLVTIVISVFFILQCIFLIYFLIIREFNHQHLLQWRICDLLSHLICLVFLSVLYRNTLIRLRAEYEIKPLCYSHINRILSWCRKPNVTTHYRKEDRFHINTRSAPRVDTISAIKETTSTPSGDDNENDVNIYRKSGVLSLPALTELSEQSSTKSKHKHESVFRKRHSHKDPKEFVSKRKELLKLSTSKLARKCHELRLPSNGTKGEIVNRLLRHKKKKHHKHHHHSFNSIESLSALSIQSPLSISHTPYDTSPNTTPKSENTTPK